MKRIKPTDNKHHWPRNVCPSVKCRKRDLVIRIADWSRQSKKTGEPAVDVEVIIGGVYDWNESESRTLREHGTKERAKMKAVAFAQQKIKELL